jgi:NAD(P)H-dependent FMN reductase
MMTIQIMAIVGSLRAGSFNQMLLQQARMSATTGKNALDWASRPFPHNALRDKPVAVIGAGPGAGGARRAQAEARTVLVRIGAKVLDEEVRVPMPTGSSIPLGGCSTPGCGSS